MNEDKLKLANDIKQKIIGAESLINICDQFGKQRYRGALPSEVTGFINDDPELCLEVINLIKQKAEAKLQKLNSEFSQL